MKELTFDDLRVGMTVRVKSHDDLKATLKGGQRCPKYGISWNDEEMSKFCGKTFVITDIAKGRNRFSLDVKKIDPDYHWVWSPSWVELPVKVSLPEDLFNL